MDAKHIRKTRDKWKREIARLPPHEGLALVADMIRETPFPIHQMPLTQLLQWPRAGTGSMAAQILTRSGVQLDRSLNQLTVQQRDELSGRLLKLSRNLTPSYA